MGPFFSSPMRKLGSFRQEIDHKLPSPDPNFELLSRKNFHRGTCKDAAGYEIYMAISTRRSHKYVVRDSNLLFQPFQPYCLLLYHYFHTLSTDSDLSLSWSAERIQTLRLSAP